MGYSQSLATGANGTVANARNKKLDIGSNLVITRQTNFREDYNVVKRVGEGSISNIYKVRTKSASGANVEKDKLYALKEIDTSLMGQARVSGGHAKRNCALEEYHASKHFENILSL